MANVIVKGRIARVSSKPFKDNRTGEDITLYSFQLEGKNQWYRTGQRPIPAGNGQDVQFVADEAKVDMGTFQVTGAPQVQSAPPVAAHAAAAPLQPSPTTSSGQTAPSTAAKGYTGNKYDDKELYWANKEARDVEKESRYQTVAEPRMALSIATEAAATIVAAAIAKDAISFGNAAKAKKLGLLSAYVKEVALELASFIHDAPNQLANFKPGAGVVDAGSDKDSSELQE